MRDSINKQYEENRYEPSGWWWSALMLLVEHFIGALLRIWSSTWKIRIYGLENVREARKSGGVMLGAWHGQLIMCAAVHNHMGFNAIVSPVWEGEIIARVLQAFGFRLIRASQRRNRISGFKSGIKILRDNKVLAMALDGPEGPVKVVKPGNITQAAAGRAFFIPSAYVCKNAVQFPTWDSQRIPLPFAEVVLVYGPAIKYTSRLRGKDLENAVEAAEVAMKTCEDEALDYLIDK